MLVTGLNLALLAKVFGGATVAVFTVGVAAF